MSNLEIRNRDRVIEELRLFLKKVMVEPDIITQSVAVAREYIDAENADELIAQHISSTTNVKIPEQHSDADRLFIDLLKEVVRDEKALY